MFTKHEYCHTKLLEIILVIFNIGQCNCNRVEELTNMREWTAACPDSAVAH